MLERRSRKRAWHIYTIYMYIYYIHTHIWCIYEIGREQHCKEVLDSYSSSMVPLLQTLNFFIFILAKNNDNVTFCRLGMEEVSKINTTTVSSGYLKQ